MNWSTYVLSQGVNRESTHTMVRRGPFGSCERRAATNPRAEYMTSGMCGTTVFLARRATLGPVPGAA